MLSEPTSPVLEPTEPVLGKQSRAKKLAVGFEVASKKAREPFTGWRLIEKVAFGAQPKLPMLRFTHLSLMALVSNAERVHGQLFQTSLRELGLRGSAPLLEVLLIGGLTCFPRFFVAGPALGHAAFLSRQ
jgi:hypothetical protein